MSNARDHLQEFTIRVANPAQAEQHARAGFAVWGRSQSWEVSARKSIYKPKYQLM